MDSIELAAPAKVNLFLRVLNRRKDSYHNILTVFERIDLADRIRISKIPRGITVRSDTFITRRQEDNLSYKAARLILSRTGEEGGVKIEIEKNIPIAAGLGGGSSDAAYTLIGVNKLYNMGLKPAVLMRLGAKLGADVPFFIMESPFAVGKARGDVLRPMRSKARFWHLIVYPGFKISTRKVYGWADFALTRRRAGAKIPYRVRDALDFGTAESMLHNDLEDIVRSKSRIVSGLIKRLAFSFGKKPILSGSGPSIFCLYRTEKEVIEARERLFKSAPVRRGWRVFIAKTC
jgi:4-diphosphocytidyl-2-C-methyl-D-erythritol kinase